MLQKLAAGILLAFSLGACSGLAPQEKLPSGNDSVELTKEQSGKFLAFVGPKLQHTQPFLGVDDTNYYCLRSWLDTRSGEVAHQLYVEFSYYGASYKWDGAQDGDGKKLRFIAISRNEITCDEGCAYADEFAAALSEDQLRARRDKGLSVTFTAQTGKRLTVDVPARLIADELGAVDATRAALKANAEKAEKTAPPTPVETPAPAPAAAPAKQPG
jgi:hypothetical protein